MSEPETFENLAAFEAKYGKITFECTFAGKHLVFTANSTHVLLDGQHGGSKPLIYGDAALGELTLLDAP